jgi:hypothetical protein
MIYLITIVKDGMKFLPIHLAAFNRLTVPWKWIVVEGTAKPVGCTSWCADMPMGVSTDGSHEWLEEVSARHPNIVHLYRDAWAGKLPMFHAATDAIARFDEIIADTSITRIVHEVDVDEIWTHRQLEDIWHLYDCTPDLFRMQYLCQYHLGPNLVVTSENTYGNHLEYEWFRTWRYQKGFQFIRHEPPVVNCQTGRRTLTPDEHDFRFVHQAYFYESQVAHKEKYYKYPGAVDQWRRLQANAKWPTKAKDFLGWIKDETVIDLLHK